MERVEITDRVLSLPEAIELLGWTRERGYRLARAGRFPGLLPRISVKYAVSERGVREFLAAAAPAEPLHFTSTQGYRTDWKRKEAIADAALQEAKETAARLMAEAMAEALMTESGEPREYDAASIGVGTIHRVTNDGVERLLLLRIEGDETIDVVLSEGLAHELVTALTEVLADG